MMKKKWSTTLPRVMCQNQRGEDDWQSPAIFKRKITVKNILPSMVLDPTLYIRNVITFFHTLLLYNTLKHMNLPTAV